jgi:hypothetical protein
MLIVPQIVLKCHDPATVESVGAGEGGSSRIRVLERAWPGGPFSASWFPSRWRPRDHGGACEQRKTTRASRLVGRNFSLLQQKQQQSSGSGSRGDGRGSRGLLAQACCSGNATAPGNEEEAKAAAACFRQRLPSGERGDARSLGAP